MPCFGIFRKALVPASTCGGNIETQIHFLSEGPLRGEAALAEPRQGNLPGQLGIRPRRKPDRDVCGTAIFGEPVDSVGESL